MCTLAVRLLGKLSVQRDGQLLDGLNSRRVQEILAYLLLHRPRSIPREVLADMLWPHSTAEQGMKYLRQALWQLKSALGCDVLMVDAEWVGLDSRTDLWLDVQQLERTYTNIRGLPLHELDAQKAQIMREALKLYCGNLLEGWYQDWCLFERERLQQMYLSLLDKYMAYCEAHGAYEEAVRCGDRALRCDFTQERVHWRLMRLHYKAGNRVAALRQYQRCAAVLREELGIRPSVRTVKLYERIRSEHPLDRIGPQLDHPDDVASERRPTSLSEVLDHLQRLQSTFAQTQRQLYELIQSVEVALKDQD